MGKAIVPGPQRMGVSRRTLLTGGAAALALGATGCRAGGPGEPGDRADSLSVRQLVKQTPFFIGSRGGARDWPEMTAYGFEQAALIPEIKAMELVVCRTADGVLVCSSDPTTKQATGQDYTILKETWATLSTLQVGPRQTRDHQQAAQPLARLDDLATRFVDRFVLVVEPRVPEAVTNLMAQLIALGRPERVVWKQPINSNRFDEAKQHGFSTWGYTLDEPAHTGRNLTRLAASDTIDLLGVSSTRSKKLVSSVIDAAQQNQKPVIGWSVVDRADLTKAVKAGFTGIATTAIAELAVLKP